MFQPGVIGAGIGAARTDNEAAIVIYVNKESRQRPILPNDLEGIPVTVILTDRSSLSRLDWATDFINSWPNCIFLFTTRAKSF